MRFLRNKQLQHTRRMPLWKLLYEITGKKSTRSRSLFGGPPSSSKFGHLSTTLMDHACLDEHQSTVGRRKFDFHKRQYHHLEESAKSIISGKINVRRSRDCSSSVSFKSPRYIIPSFPSSTFSSISHPSISSSTTTTNSNPLPESVDVIVVGGGIIGLSVSYHLAKLYSQQSSSSKRVLLLERDRLTSGTTWHAAGLMVTFGSLNGTSTEMRKYTKHLYSEILPQETNLETGYRSTGFIELASTPDHLHYYRRVASYNRFHGIDVQELTPPQIQHLFPLCDISDDVAGGFYVPTDGRVNPVDVSSALAAGGRLYGVDIREGVTVSSVTTTTTTTTTTGSEDDDDDDVLLPSVTGVRTSCGRIIRAETAVVNCTGMWARQFGESMSSDNGVIVPNQAAEHYYLITEAIPHHDVKDWPVLEDPHRCTYIRPEGDGLLIGFFERVGAALWSSSSCSSKDDDDDAVPMDFSFGEIEPDWERMGPYVEEAMGRVPAVLDVGIKSFFCGPESFTPDNYPIVGEAPGLRGYFVAAGLNSIGILTGGGIGKLLSEWIINNHHPVNTDITSINISRFHPHQNNPEYRTDRVSEALGNTYKLHYPDYSPKTCRGVKRSVLHDRMKATGAHFKDVSGWESPAFFGTGDDDDENVGVSFERESWFGLWRDEHLACREGVALFDMSFMSKFLVQGPNAGRFLNHLSTANVDSKPNRITYTQWLNEQGRMEADLTITKLSPESFLVVATDTMHNHVLTHMKRRLTSTNTTSITDVTGAYAQLNIQGPQSRRLLQSLTHVNVDNEQYPFRHAREIDMGYARVWCMRITYVGELGYELFIPVEFAAYVYDLIVERGKELLVGLQDDGFLGLKHAGLRALGSLRMEKGYRDYGHDMDNTDTLLECGLGFTCDFDKPDGFIGMDHVLAQKKSVRKGGLEKRLVSVLVRDPDPLLHHGEILWRDGEMICDIRSASYGHTLGGAVGLAMVEGGGNGRLVDRGFLEGGVWEVETPSGRYECDVSLSAFYDPKNLKVRL